MTEEIKSRIGLSAEDHPNWTNGQWISNEGRVFIRVPKEERHLHPTIRKDGYIQRYQYIWNMAHPEDPVMPGDVIHHKDENKQNDDLSNLEKTTQSEHARHHMKGNSYGLGWKHTEESKERMRAAWRNRRKGGS